MLDIYYIDRHNTSIPDGSDGLPLAGSIDLDTHKALSKIFDKCEEDGLAIQYFDDTLIPCGDLPKIAGIFSEYAQYLPDTSVAREGFEKMMAILIEASKKNCGLVFFSD